MDHNLMEVDSQSSPLRPTVLRVKRKRTEQPIDSIVVDATHIVKRQKVELGESHFELAGTAEAGQEGEVIKVCLIPHVCLALISDGVQ